MKCERGSTIPLVIGLAVLLLATLVVTGELQSYQMQRQRALEDARFAAIYIAKESASIPPVIGLEYAEAVRSQLHEADLVSVTTSDGQTFDARVCYRWQSLFKTGTVSICDTAKARIMP